MKKITLILRYCSASLLPALLLLVYALIGFTSAAQSIQPSKNEYKLNEEILVRFSGFPVTGTELIAIYTLPDNSVALPEDLKGTGTEAKGSVTLKLRYPKAGKYLLAAFSGGQTLNHVIAISEISVTTIDAEPGNYSSKEDGRIKPEVRFFRYKVPGNSPDKAEEQAPSYGSDDKIILYYSGFPGTVDDRIMIRKISMGEIHPKLETFNTEMKQTGRIVCDALPPATYEVVVFTDKSSEAKFIKQFTVTRSSRKWRG